jgi:acetolactate synthase-1/3 small subunit
MRHIISVLLENESGALSRVSGLFSARGYNIESLTVAPTHDSSLSRMTIVTSGDERRIDQIEKQLFKLVDVAALQDITVNRHLEREIALVKLEIEDHQKSQLTQTVEVFQASLIEISDHLYIVELSSSGEKIDELIRSLSSLNIIETARSGVIGLANSERALTVN